MPRKKKPKAVNKYEWTRLGLVEDVVHDLVKRHHQHLMRATIIVLGKPKATRALGRTIIATPRKVSAAMQALLKDHIGEAHYLIEIGQDEWEKLDGKTKRIHLDRALCCFGGHDIEKDRWTMATYDVQEFTPIVARHGAWNATLEVFGRTLAQQLDLFPEKPSEA